MVVPSATGVYLLKEHAWYEYGRPEYISVMDFDYIYGQKDTVNLTSYNVYSLLVCFFVILPFSLYSLYTLTKLLKPALRSHKLQPPFLLLRHSNTNTLPRHSQDCAPELSFSCSTTPSSSPYVPNTRFNAYNIDENPYVHTKPIISH